jgi:hypothetical protein
MNGTQLFMAVGMPTLAVLIGVLVNHWHVSAINARVTDVRQDMDARLKRLEEQ